MASLCAGNGKMNKGMVEWTNMSVINRPIKNSKMSGKTMSTLRKNVRLIQQSLSLDDK